MPRFMSDLGALRCAMALVVVFLVVMSPFSLAPASPHGWSIIPTVLSPALFVIFVFVLPLDLVMTLVFRSDREGDERERLSRVLLIETVLTVALIASWTPFVLSLVEQTP